MARYWLGICLLLRTRTAMYWIAVLSCTLLVLGFMHAARSVRGELDAIRTVAAHQNSLPSTLEPDSSSSRSNNRLENFVAILTPRKEYADLLLNMWDLSDREDMLATHSDYRVERDMKGKFSKVMVTMPVKAPYQSLKRYVFKLLAENPGLALSKMEIKAGQIGADRIDAELTFTLLVSEP